MMFVHHYRESLKQWVVNPPLHGHKKIYVSLNWAQAICASFGRHDYNGSVHHPSIQYTSQSNLCFKTWLKSHLFVIGKLENFLEFIMLLLLWARVKQILHSNLDIFGFPFARFFGIFLMKGNGKGFWLMSALFLNPLIFSEYKCTYLFFLCYSYSYGL